jgi:hypothetical protein
MDMSNLLVGLETVWAHQSVSDAFFGLQELSTLTTIVFPNGPVKFLSNGSSVGVILKQRPQASPKLELAPNASSLTAALNPELNNMPQPARGRRAQRGLHGVPKPKKKKKKAQSLLGLEQSSADVKDACPLGF